MAESRNPSRPRDAIGAPGRLPTALPENGFTLVELLVVVVIIGVLIAIAIPVYMTFVRSARDKAAESDVRAAVSALESCRNTAEQYPGTPGDTVTVTSAVTVCSGQQASVSPGSTVSYTVAADAFSYTVVGHNERGSAHWYCINTAVSGSIRTFPAAVSSC